MVVTVVLTGIPRHVPLVELADAINKFLSTNEVASFVTRETVARKGKRQVALDFKDGFNAMAAQDILNGYRYMLKDDDKEYVLSARVSKDPSVMPGDELVPYSAGAVASSSRDYSYEVYDHYEEKLHELKKRMELVKTETEFLKAKKELKKWKKKYVLDESESEAESKRKHSKKKKKKKKRRHSSSSSAGSMGTALAPLRSPSPPAETDRKPSKKSRMRSESSRSSSPAKRPRLSPLLDTQRVRYKETPPSSASLTKALVPYSRQTSPERVLKSPLPSSRRSRWDSAEYVSGQRKSSPNKTPAKKSKSEKLREKSVEKKQTRKKSLERGREKHKIESHKRYSSSKSSERDSCSRSSSSTPRKHQKSRCPRDRKSRSPKSVKKLASSSSEHRRDKQRRSSPKASSSRYVSPERSVARSRYDSRERSIARSRYESLERPGRSKPDRKRRRDSSDDRSRSYHRSPGRKSPIRRRHSPSPAVHSSRRSPYRSPTRRALNAYKDYYRDPYEDAYMGITNKSRAEDSNVVFVSREEERYGYMRPAEYSPSPSPPPTLSAHRPPRATVTEIEEDGEIIDDLDDVLEGVDKLVEDERSPTRINVNINVIPERKRDTDRDLDDDKARVRRIKTEIDKATDRKKSKPSREYDEDIRKAMPRPMVDTEHIKQEPLVWSEVIKIEEDDHEIPYKPPKKISKNPRFVIAVTKLIKKMNSHIKDIPEETKRTFLGIMRKILRMRIKKLLEGKNYYMPTAAILELYREVFPVDEDCKFVLGVVEHMREGKFDGFVPSDDEEEEGKKDTKVSEIPPIFDTYIDAKKKKGVFLKSVENKENSVSSAIKTSPKDDDVVILEKKVDVIDITEVEEGKIKQEPVTTANPSASNDSDIICIDCEDGIPPIVKQEAETPKDVGEMNISVKTENTISDAAIPDEGINQTVAKVKTEMPEETPAVVAVKSENIYVEPDASNCADSIATTEYGRDVGDPIEDSKPDIRFIKSEPPNSETDIDSDETVDLGAPDANLNIESVSEMPAKPAEADREGLINEIITLSNDIIFNKPQMSNGASSETNNPVEQTDLNDRTTNKEIEKSNEKNRTDNEKEQRKNPEVSVDTGVKKEIPEQEETLESIENYVDLHTKVIEID